MRQTQKMGGLLLTALVFSCVTLTLTQTQSTKPNIVFILADDLGWDDVSFHGSNEIPTPNLDALAYDGIILGNYYVQPICTPTRSALMTGRHPIHTGMQRNVIVSSEPYGLGLNETLLPEYLNTLGYSSHIVGKVGMQRSVITSSCPYGLGLNETIIPQYLKDLGYATHIVGKWHLGFFAKEYTPLYRGYDTHFGYYMGEEDYWDHTCFSKGGLGWHLGLFAKAYTPLERGFSSHFGYYQGCGDYYDHTYEAGSDQSWGLDFRRNSEVVKDAFGQYSTELFSQETDKLIADHNTSKPMFLYMAHQAVHSANLRTGNNLEAPWKYVNKFQHIKNKQRRLLAGMISALDDAVGNLTKALQAKGMLENTIIVFSTDNGGPANGFDGNMASNAPLRGLKSTLWEGGVRGAGFIWSPLLERSGVISHDMFQVIDWLPTFLRVAGYDMSKLPTNVDGMDLWDTLSGNIDKSRTEMLHNIDKSDGVALRINHMKLVHAMGSTSANDKWYQPKQVLIEKRKRGETDHMLLNSKENVLEMSQEELAVFKSQFHSDLPQIFESMGRPKRDGKPYVVKCSDKPSKVAHCVTKPCLFNITADPCEYHDLSAQHPDILDKLMWWCAQYNATVVPPRNKPVDPKGLPYYHGGVWTPWVNLTAEDISLAKKGIKIP